MVFCVIALVVFGILSLFSATHRPIAKEAFDCVFRKITLRPCNTGLDKRLRMLISMKVMKHHQGLGKAVHKHFEALSFAFTVLFIASILITGLGIYNLAVYGNCNGETNQFCAFDPDSYASNPWYLLFPPSPEQVKMVPIQGLPMKGNSQAELTVVEIGCYSCPFTRGAEPIVDQMLKDYGNEIVYYYKNFPLPSHQYSEITSQAAECARDQGKYWEYREKLFTRQTACNSQPNEKELKELLKRFAQEIELNRSEFDECLGSGKYSSYVEEQKQESIDAGVYATPTFIIGEKVVVSPQNYADLKDAIDAALEERQ